MDRKCGSIARRSKVSECTKTVCVLGETASVAFGRRHSISSDILGISGAVIIQWVDNGWVFRCGSTSRWRSVSLSNSLSIRTDG